jgi:hypothetical protein
MWIVNISLDVLGLDKQLTGCRREGVEGVTGFCPDFACSHAAFTIGTMTLMGKLVKRLVIEHTYR